MTDIATELRTRQVETRRDGPPAFTYLPVPGVPSVSVLRFGPGTPEWPPGAGHRHFHDFPLMCYFDHGGGEMQIASRAWRVDDGDVYVVAPGEIVGVSDPTGMENARGWGVLFLPEALGPQAPGSLLAWRTHPLLSPFARGAAGGATRLRVPIGERPGWSERMESLDRELRRRRDGYQPAVLSLLTLLLVDLARLVSDVAGEFRLNGEPLLADVFTFIEAQYRAGISLADVAAAVNLTPGYLTTLVRQKTGRPVQEWIAERRLTQARRLLVETDLSVDEIGDAIGYHDPGYFTRQFKRSHGVTPLAWRRASRG